VVVGFAALTALASCSRGPSTATNGTSTTASTATTAGTDAPGTTGPAAGSYSILEAVNLRSATNSKGKALAKIPAGTAVVVQCVGKGETVERAKKSDARWDKVTYNTLSGYVSNAYVDTKGDIDDPKKIPPC